MNAEKYTALVTLDECAACMYADENSAACDTCGVNDDL
jgi:hypothetical protein